MIFHSVAMNRIRRVPLMMSLLGNFHILGGIIVSILAKFWIAVVWYVVCLWCLTAVFTLILAKLM